MQEMWQISTKSHKMSREEEEEKTNDANISTITISVVSAPTVTKWAIGLMSVKTWKLQRKRQKNTLMKKKKKKITQS